MSITFDPEKFSTPWRTRDFEESNRRPVSPRVVTLSDLPYFKGKKDIEGDAYFRRFTDDSDTENRGSKKASVKNID
jgi:hypothetical protein